MTAVARLDIDVLAGNHESAEKRAKEIARHYFGDTGFTLKHEYSQTGELSVTGEVISYETRWTARPV